MSEAYKDVAAGGRGDGRRGDLAPRRPARADGGDQGLIPLPAQAARRSFSAWTCRRAARPPSGRPAGRRRSRRGPAPREALRIIRGGPAGDVQAAIEETVQAGPEDARRDRGAHRAGARRALLSASRSGERAAGGRPVKPVHDPAPARRSALPGGRSRAPRGRRSRPRARLRAAHAPPRRRAAAVHQSSHPRDEPVPPPARAQPGRLARRGATRRSTRRARERPAGLPLRRLLDLPLVPRHGARVLRGRGDRAAS